MRRYRPNLPQYFSTCSSSQKAIQDDVERQQVTLKVRYEQLAMTHFYTLPEFELIRENTPPKRGFDMIGLGMRVKGCQGTIGSTLATVYPTGIDRWCSRMGFLGFIISNPLGVPRWDRGTSNTARPPLTLNRICPLQIVSIFGEVIYL